MIPAFGAHRAFTEALTPFVLYEIAASAGTPEVREELEEFAADFAMIRDLPELVTA